MSLSRPNLTNPATRFYTWKGSEGKLVWWDKENSKEIEVPLPFKFIPIDQLSTVTGYSDTDGSGFWANEVKFTTDDLTVKTKRGVKYVGPYKDSKGIVQIGSGATQGARYAKSIYIAQKLDDEWVIANIKAVGVSLSAWIDFDSKNHAEGKVVALVGSTEGSKGATKFRIPTFEYGGSTPEDLLDIATSLDNKLQAYLDKYLTQPKYDDNTEPIYEDSLATAEQIADFEARKAQQNVSKVFAEPLPEPPSHMDDEPINLDDIPF